MLESSIRNLSIEGLQLVIAGAQAMNRFTYRDELERREKKMPILMFPCSKCKKPMGFDYADDDLRDAVNSEKSPYHRNWNVYSVEEAEKVLCYFYFSTCDNSSY